MMADGIRKTGQHSLLCLYFVQTGFMFLFFTKDRRWQASLINLFTVAVEHSQMFEWINLGFERVILFQNGGNMR